MFLDDQLDNFWAGSKHPCHWVFNGEANLICIQFGLGSVASMHIVTQRQRRPFSGAILYYEARFQITLPVLAALAIQIPPLSFR